MSSRLRVLGIGVHSASPLYNDAEVVSNLRGAAEDQHIVLTNFAVEGMITARADAVD
jgi:hypothetical protein